MFPLYLRRLEDDPLPEEPIAYVVGSNGIFIQKTTSVFRATVPATQLPMLAPVNEGATYLLPASPPEIAAQTIAFFRQVYAAHRSEAILLLSYHAQLQMFRLDAPSQEVSSGRCPYDMPSRAMDGFTFVGTFHSHADGGAYHSGTDSRDEKEFDGVHCTFGRFNQPEGVDIVASLVISGRRFTLEPEHVFSGLRRVEWEVSAPRPIVLTKAGELDSIIDRHSSTRGPRRAHGKNGKYAGVRSGAFRQFFTRFFPTAGRIERFISPAQPLKPVFLGYEVDVPTGTPQEAIDPDPSWMANVHPWVPPQGSVGSLGWPMVKPPWPDTPARFHKYADWVDGRGMMEDDDRYAGMLPPHVALNLDPQSPLVVASPQQDNPSSIPTPEPVQPLTYVVRDDLAARGDNSVDRTETDVVNRPCPDGPEEGDGSSW